MAWRRGVGRAAARRPLARRVAAIVVLATALVGVALPAGASNGPVRLTTEGELQTAPAGLYAFVSPDRPSSVTLIATWMPLQAPVADGVSSFSTSAVYDINVDNDGDGKADLVYRWDFEDHVGEDALLQTAGVVTDLNDPVLNVYQTYDLTLLRPGRARHVLVSDGMAAPDNAGEAVMPDYERLRDEAVVRMGTGKAFAGPADDPFFGDLAVLDRFLAGHVAGAGEDTMAGFNVSALALQVPKAALARQRDPSRHPVIGVWSSAFRRKITVLRQDGSIKERGPLVQVTRLGMPLVREAIIPAGEQPRWQAAQPRSDGVFRDRYSDPLVARAREATRGPAPDSDMTAPGVQRKDLLQVFLAGVPGLNRISGKVTLSDQLRLNMSLPPCSSEDCDTYSAMGVIGGDFAGFPNGRRLDDGGIDSILQILEGELLDKPNDLSDGVDTNDVALGERFPYLALPHPAGEARPG